MFCDEGSENPCFFLRLFSTLPYMKKFTTLCAFLSEMDRKAYSTINFSDLCLRFDADFCRMDNLMYATFGMSGDDLIRNILNEREL